MDFVSSDKMAPRVAQYKIDRLTLLTMWQEENNLLNIKYLITLMPQYLCINKAIVYKV